MELTKRRKYEFLLSEGYHHYTPNTLPNGAILQGFRDNTTAHGISHVNIARGPVKKGFWTFFGLVSVALLLYYGETLFERFFTWPVTVTVSVEHRSELTFPAITVCNMNPILLSEVEKDQYLSSLLGLNSSPDNTANSNTTATSNTTTSSTNTTGTSGGGGGGSPGRRKRQAGQGGPKNAKGKSLGDDFLKNLQFRQYIAELDITQKMALGHRLDEFVLQCEFAGYPCEVSDFYQFYNSKYGNCFIFNHGWNSSDSSSLEVSRTAGPEYGLSLTFNIDQDEYVGSFAPSAGIRVVIHPQDVMPFPEDDGITVAPGAITYIGLRKEDIYRQSEPYGNCTDTSLEDTVPINVYEELFPVKYTTKGCLKTCIQKNIIDTCNCAQSDYPITGIAFAVDKSPICDATNATQAECTDSVLEKFKNGNLNCNCATSCEQTVYTTLVSSGYWPSNANKDSIFATLVDVSEKVKGVIRDVVNPAKYKENLASINVYFEEFNLETIRELPAYQAGQFVSDIGGILGLFIGFSVLTILEFVELAMDYLVLCCYRKCSRKRRDSFIRSRTSPSDDSNGNGHINLISKGGPPPYCTTLVDYPVKGGEKQLYMEDL